MGDVSSLWIGCDGVGLRGLGRRLADERSGNGCTAQWPWSGGCRLVLLSVWWSELERAQALGAAQSLLQNGELLLCQVAQQLSVERQEGWRGAEREGEEWDKDRRKEKKREEERDRG